MKKQRIDEYRRKEQQSKLYRELEQECHVWFCPRILTLGKQQQS